MCWSSILVTYLDLGIGFSWLSTFNGTSGGVGTTKNSLPVDAGSGTGGITVTNVNEITGYQYPKSFGVTGINGFSITPPASTSTALTADQISVTSTGLVYNRFAQTHSGTVTIKNISSSAIDGPFQLVLVALTSGVTLTNATSSFGGWPYFVRASRARRRLISTMTWSKLLPLPARLGPWNYTSIQSP